MDEIIELESLREPHGEKDNDEWCDSPQMLFETAEQMDQCRQCHPLLLAIERENPAVVMSELSQKNTIKLYDQATDLVCELRNMFPYSSMS